MFSSFEIAKRMDIFEGKNKSYSKQLTKIGGKRVFLRRRPWAAMFVVSFPNLISHVLSHNLLGDHMITRRAKVRN